MEEKRRLLIIFARNPIKGSVKTRLAARIGDDAAFKIYIQLLEHTVQITGGTEAVREIHFSSAIPENLRWDNFEPKLQKGQDLGARMEHAFKEGFRERFEQVVLIGSDLPDLRPEDLQQAFSALDSHDYVFGPAVDGGYYLIGMKSLNSKLFEHISWGSSTVLQETLGKLKNKTLTLLNKRRDLDTYEDLLAFPQFQHFYKEKT